MITRTSRTRSVLLVLALVFFGLLLTSAEILHAHRSGDVGLYNTECPLAEIAARHGDASLPSAPPTVATPWTVEPAPAAVPSNVPAPPVSSADSRAPPLA
jgi:hypothetical protein